MAPRAVASVASCRPVSAVRWLLTGHVNFSTSLRGGVSISMQDVMGSQDLVLYVQILCGTLLPRPRAAGCPAGEICNTIDTDRQKPAFCPYVGNGRVSSQVADYSTCGNSTHGGNRRTSATSTTTPRNSSPQPKPALIVPFLEATLKGHKLSAYLHSPVPDEFR